MFPLRLETTMDLPEELLLSKYDPIFNFLRGKSGPDEVSLAALAGLVDGGLPASAYRHSAWWSTDDDTHVQ